MLSLKHSAMCWPFPTQFAGFVLERAAWSRLMFGSMLEEDEDEADDD